MQGKFFYRRLNMATMELMDFKDWMDNVITKDIPFLKHSIGYIYKKRYGVPSVIGGIICGTLSWGACYYNYPWNMLATVGYGILV